jgi:hypothetical protein
MKSEIQDFPRLTIECLPSGLIRFEDDSCIDGPQVIDAHPCQVQIAASMLGFNMPDKTRAALARMSRRLHALHKQAQELESQLTVCVVDQDIHVAPELTAAEFIAFNLGELLEDIEAIQAPDLEPAPDAMVNPGGQLTLPV